MERCEATLQDLQSCRHVEGIWQEGLPAKAFPTKSQSRLEELYKHHEALRSDWQDLYVDPHSSSSRKLEHAVGVTPCLRPSNSVWSARMKRFLTATEHMRLQGLFPQDFGNPDAVLKLCQQRTLAMDCAGKAFCSAPGSSTVFAGEFLVLGSHREACNTIAIQAKHPHHKFLHIRRPRKYIFCADCFQHAKAARREAQIGLLGQQLPHLAAPVALSQGRSICAKAQAWPQQKRRGPQAVQEGCCITGVRQAQGGEVPISGEGASEAQGRVPRHLQGLLFQVEEGGGAGELVQGCGVYGRAW